MGEVAAKISAARKFIDSEGLECLIEVDGGIDLKTAPKVVAAGADILVTGSAFYKSGDYGEFVQRIRDTAGVSRKA